MQKLGAYDNFLGALRNSPATKAEYERKIRVYQKFHNVKDWNAYVRKSPDAIHEDLLAYIHHAAGTGVLSHTIKNMLSPVILLLEMNRVPVHKKILKKQLPASGKVPAGHEPFTRYDIEQMLKVSKSFRTRALIHFWASTGCRPASIVDPVLLKRNVVEMPEGCAAVKIYDDHKDGYWAFLTPEAYRALKDYLNARKLNGEKITDDSPLFTNHLNIAGTRGQPISIRSAREIMFRTIQQAKIERKRVGKRYDKAAIYGFRHRFNTILKLENSLNSNIAEKLMAHRNGLDGVYLNPTREECFAEFKKAVLALSIDQSERLALEKADAEAKITELQKKELEISDMK